MATWEALAPQLEEIGADRTIVGSYHSHPGVGVFLSPTDMITQQSAFAHPWQIALVIDPQSEEIGFFTGEMGIPCPDWRPIQSL